MSSQRERDHTAAQPGRSNFSFLVRTALVSLATTAVLAVELEWPAPLRAAAVLGFLCMVPGAAVVGLAPRMEALAAGALSLALSLAVSTVVALGAVMTDNYEPELMMELLAAVSIVLLLWRPRARNAAGGDADSRTDTTS